MPYLSFCAFEEVVFCFEDAALLFETEEALPFLLTAALEAVVLFGAVEISRLEVTDAAMSLEVLKAALDKAAEEVRSVVGFDVFEAAMSLFTPQEVNISSMKSARNAAVCFFILYIMTGSLGYIF